jgi:hypothetical protein
VDIIGVGENLIPGVPLCTAAGLIQTTTGPIIGIMHNYAALGKGGSIHSPVQMKDFGIVIDDTLWTQKQFDGEQGTQMVRIPTGDEGRFFDIDLTISGGLAYFNMQPPTQEQLNDETIPHVIMTSGMDWDPTKYDDQQDTVATPEAYHPTQIHTLEIGIDDDSMVMFAALDGIYPEESHEDAEGINDEFTEIGEDVPTNQTLEHSDVMVDPYEFVPNVMSAVACFNRKIDAKLTHVEHKYGKTLEQLRPNFAWASIESIKNTLDASTQFYRATQWTKKIKRHYKSRFPGANIDQINETVCTDTAFMEETGRADGIAGHSGSVGFQIFVGNETKHIAVYTVQTDGDYPKVIREYIRAHGAPKKVFSDNAKAQISAKAKEIYRNFGISDGSSEPHYQNQNAAEREIQDVKKDVTMILNITNTPYEWWPLCVEYVAIVKNHTSRPTLGNRTPMEKRTGQTPDVSKLLQYRWWEPVYFLDEEGVETLGRWAGIAENVSDELTFIVVSDATSQAMFRSDLRTATDPNAPNF